MLFYDDQDTESEQLEIQMRIYQLIFTHKNIPKALWDNDIHTLKIRENIVVIIHIYGDKAIFLLFYDDQDTEYK